MGRRWGKTVMGGALTLATAAGGGKVAWVVPQYKNGRPMWRWAESTVAPLRKAGRASINRTERVIEFDNGGLFGVYSADSPDSIRGEWFHLVVLDEAARIDEETWQGAIQPTLADAGGDAILISTPKGKNWFYHEWQRGQRGEDDIRSWTAPTAANPNPRIQAAAEKARERVPELTYRQEWLAEFIDNDGQVFRRVRGCVDPALPCAEPYNGSFLMGLDWAKEGDYTVATVIDMNTRRVVDIDRFNKIDYSYQRERVKALYHKWKVQTIVAESNSIGTPNIELLVADDISVFPFNTSNTSKQVIIERLVVAIESQTIAYPDNPVLIGELEAYEMSRTKTGLVSYSAPEGQHDDMVVSLALALWGCA